MGIALTLPVADSWGMHGDVGAGWMILMMALMVLFWGAVILGIAWLVRAAGRSGSPPPVSGAATESPVEVLERRFAEGEISSEAFRARRAILLEARSERVPSGAVGSSEEAAG